LLVPVDVDGVGRKVEDVTATSHEDDVGRAQRNAQLRHQRLQAIPHAGRWIFPPQVVYHLLGRHNPTDVQRQYGEQCLLLATRDDDIALVVISDLQSAEEPDPHDLEGTGDRQLVVSAR
jgi:hypothetical protein